MISVTVSNIPYLGEKFMRVSERLLNIKLWTSFMLPLFFSVQFNSNIEVPV